MVNPSLIRLLVVVNPAFDLVATGPTPGALVFIPNDRARARHTADRRVARVVQRVVRNLVDVDVGLDALRVPVDDRLHLPDAVALRPLHAPRVLPRQRLLAADAADPRVVVREDALERLDLADVAAAVGIALPEVRSLPRVLLGHRDHLRTDQLQPVALDEPIPRLVRLPEEELRVELDHRDVQAELADHVHEHGGLPLPRAR